MRIDEIEIHTGDVDFTFEPIRRLEAKCEAATNFSKAPTIEDVNHKLREMAASISANAIVNVKYESGPTWTSWRSVRGSGLAVKRVSDDTPCPQCAETIKRAARRCRFCGAEISEVLPVPSNQPVSPVLGEALATAPSVDTQEPLRASDNVPVWAWILVMLVLAGIFIFANS